MGGLGNNLFQIEHALKVKNKSDEIIFVTNLIEIKLYSFFFGWTFHENSLNKFIFPNDVKFVKINNLLVIKDLILLFLHRKLNKLDFNIQWEGNELKKVNFGYFQYNRDKPSFKLKNKFNFIEIEKPIVHLRLGDSPTLYKDFNKQINLIKSLNYTEYIILTNDTVNAIELLKNENINCEIISISSDLDFFLMLHSKILICPQSTFSWMAGYFNEKLEKIYIPVNLWDKLKFNTNAEIIIY